MHKIHTIPKSKNAQCDPNIQSSIFKQHLNIVLTPFFRFVCKNNGVLFENDLIQIGVKSEFRQNLGRIGLFYGNKTQHALHSFQPQLSWTDENQAKLAVQVKPVDPILEAGAQIQQMINAECIDDYNGMLF